MVFLQFNIMEQVDNQTDRLKRNTSQKYTDAAKPTEEDV